MKNKNKIITLVVAVVLTIITCIPIFATTINGNLPSDLGNLQTSNTYYNPTVNCYVKVNATGLATNTVIGTITIYYSETYKTEITLTKLDNTIRLSNIYRGGSWLYTYSINTAGITGQYNYDINYTSGDLYISVSAYCIYEAYLNFGVKIDAVNTGSSYMELYTQINPSSYNTGYNNGYNAGYTDGFNYAGQNDFTNITGYVEQLLAKFVGIEHARYLTPISIVLVILLVYFLFIRFLLSLIKAKGVIKTCDIIMIVACIILLVVMYAPMLDLTIKTEAVTETIETTESTQIRRTEYIYDEYGRIISGPAGTIIYEDIETTTSEQEQTEVEVTSQYLEKEITTYEETEEIISRN